MSAMKLIVELLYFEVLCRDVDVGVVLLIVRVHVHGRSTLWQLYLI